jgi:hypothetical protein
LEEGRKEKTLATFLPEELLLLGGCKKTHNQHTAREKRGRRRKDKSVQI